MIEIGRGSGPARHLDQPNAKLVGSHSNQSKIALTFVTRASLILFDIDGTLVRRAGPHHRQALVDAIRQVTGAATTTEGIPVHGMLDPDILTLMLRAAGFHAAEIASAMPAIIETAQDLYEATVPDLRDKTCPGVVPLLESTARPRHDTGAGHRQSDPHRLAQTGTRRSARLFPLRRLRRNGGDARRSGQAGHRTGAHRGISLRPMRRISLIGDAPQDVRAAQENGIRSIAVRTGITPPGELEACQPDLILDDLTCLDYSHHLE